MNRAAKRGVAVVLALAAGVACRDDPAGPDWPVDPDTPYDLTIPTQWSDAISHPLLPLIPGTRWEFEGETEDGTETIVVEVLSEKRLVNGVSATIVWDRVYLDDELIEDTRDWYAQDVEGNVWYLGEESYEMAGSDTLNSAGSWEWGVDGALPGVIMWSDPASYLDEPYRQEYYEGEAEDWGVIVATDVRVEVPAGAFSSCLQTEDWNALEDYEGSLEQKFYCPGIGWVREVPVEDPEESVELTDFEQP
jgi:hypothetical protein